MEKHGEIGDEREIFLQASNNSKASAARGEGNTGSDREEGGTGRREKKNEEEEEGDDMALCMLLLGRHVHVLPGITFIFIVLSFVISYVVSASQENVRWDFPFISHVGSKLPERCIFSQLVNIGAFLLGVNVFIRFLQQTADFRRQPGRRCATNRRLCIFSLVFGWLSAVGLSMVASFQVLDMRSVHYVGAFLAFIMGFVYCWLQTSLSLRRHPRDCVTRVQLLNSVVLTLSLVLFIVSVSVFRIKESRGEGTKHGVLRPVYLVATTSEWVAAILEMLFLLTFCRDFSRITLQVPRVQLKQDHTVTLTTNGNTHRANSASHSDASSA